MSETSFEPRYATRASGMRASEIRELLKLLEQPGIISFAGGIPDPVLFPVEEARKAYDEALKKPETAERLLQYTVSEGDVGLRGWIVRHMAGLGVPCTPDNILITNGSQQGLEFLGKMLISPGDTALTAAPTYLGALQAFSAYEPNYDTLGDETSNRSEASYKEQAAKNGGTVKFAYLVPDFANPSGETLSLAGRKRLLTLSRDLDIPIIEDTAYGALRFEGEPIAPIQALDIADVGSIEKSRVIYCGTFSKTLTPGLRVGWICASSALIRRLVLVKQACDLHSPALNQVVMHHMAESVYDKQVAKARTHYRKKRDLMLQGLEAHMPKGVHWTKPEGGLFIWVTLPEGMDGAKLLEQAIAEEQVAFVPGKAFYPDGSGANSLRLSFSQPSEEAIVEGTKRLGALLTRLSAKAA